MKIHLAEMDWSLSLSVNGVLEALTEFVKTTVVGKGGFWGNSPYTWFNYIQINHTCGWNTNIIRVPTTCMVRHNLEFTE